MKTMEACNSLNKRSVMEKMIHDIFDGLEQNNFFALGRTEDSMWEEPIIGIAAGDDPYYEYLKEHIGSFHWTPAEAFAQKYGEMPDASGLRVISMAFPQTRQTKDMQKLATDFPSDNWLVTRGEWEPLIKVFCERLEEAFAQKGIRAVCPDLLPGMKWMMSDKQGHASTWSQRHTAYTAGLGTFSMNDGLITLKGIAMRFTSVIVEAAYPVNGKVSDDPYAWCSHCGACVRRCPVEAISPVPVGSGHIKDTCAEYEDYCIENLWPPHIPRGDYIFGCGLCQAGVPCSDHPPAQGGLHYRQIQASDDSQLAQLVRMSLKDHDLNIPGTAYYDLQLDQLCEYYQAEPAKRSYIVAVDGQERVVGGVGIDDFERLEGCAELQKLYVADDCKCQGIGHQLMDMIEAEARRLGYDQIYLETHSNLAAAQKLYESIGYKSIKRPAFSIHATMDRFMIKKLK